MWHTGQAWRVVNSLNKLNEQIRAYAPASVPPATDVNSWGSIADDEHSSTSDHYPHYYASLGGTAVVCARDFPHAPGLGLDGGVVTEHMRQVHDSRVQYIIFNRRITGVSYGWQWHTYTGDDPHDTHFHVSSIRTVSADGVQPWSLPAGPATITVEEHSMALMAQMANDTQVWLLGAGGKTKITSPAIRDQITNGVPVNNLTPAQFDEFQAAMAAPATAVNVNAADVAAALATNTVFLSAIAEAVADEQYRRQAG